MSVGGTTCCRPMVTALVTSLCVMGLCVGCSSPATESPNEGLPLLTESLGQALPDDAVLLLCAGTKSGYTPVWVIRHQKRLSISQDAHETACPVSAVAASLTDLRADPQLIGAIQGSLGRFLRWEHGGWEFRLREVKTDQGLLSVIERFPTEAP